MSQIRQCIQSDVLCVMCVKVLFDVGTLLGHFCCADRDRHQFPGSAQDAENQDLKKMPAYKFGTVSAAFYFMIHLFKQFFDQMLIGKITENLCRGCSALFLECDSVDPEDIVLQRSVGKRLLCMVQIRGNDDEVSGLDRPDLLAEDKSAFAAYDKEDLGKRMCVEDAWPVLLIPGQSDGEKAGMDLRDLIFFDGIMAVAHGDSSLLVICVDLIIKDFWVKASSPWGTGLLSVWGKDENGKYGKISEHGGIRRV